MILFIEVQEIFLNVNLNSIFKKSGSTELIMNNNSWDKNKGIESNKQKQVTQLYKDCNDKVCIF